jgi:hypothetical protein
MFVGGRNRGGTRGGQGEFTWDQVKNDKDRENYLGHSIMAPVGRWQKNKDLQWFSKGGGQRMHLCGAIVVWIWINAHVDELISISQPFSTVSAADELKRRQELALIKQQEQEALACMLYVFHIYGPPRCTPRWVLICDISVLLTRRHCPADAETLCPTAYEQT